MSVIPERQEAYIGGSRSMPAQAKIVRFYLKNN
jgi:hypothetical protein